MQINGKSFVTALMPLKKLSRTMRSSVLAPSCERSFISGEHLLADVMAPSFMRRRESVPELDEDIAAELIEQIEEGPRLRWTLVSRVSDQMNRNPEEVRETLRQLTLQGKVTPTADGDLRKALIEA